MVGVGVEVGVFVCVGVGVIVLTGVAVNVFNGSAVNVFVRMEVELSVIAITGAVVGFSNRVQASRRIKINNSNKGFFSSTPPFIFSTGRSEF